MFLQDLDRDDLVCSFLPSLNNLSERAFAQEFKNFVVISIRRTANIYMITVFLIERTSQAPSPTKFNLTENENWILHTERLCATFTVCA